MAQINLQNLLNILNSQGNPKIDAIVTEEILKIIVPDINELKDGLAALGLEIDNILTDTIDVVNMFADLPSAATAGVNALALVKTTTGILFINRKRKGIYVSDGTNWNYAAEFAADQLSYDDTISALGADNVQDAIEALKVLVDAGGGGGGAVASVNGQTGIVVLNKTDIGLGNVDNTSDANKPVSTAQATAIGLKQDTLVSGTNIKTVNGNSLLGSGNIVISGSGSSVTQVIVSAPFSYGYSEVVVTDATITTSHKIIAILFASTDEENDVEELQDNDVRIMAIPQTGTILFILTSNGPMVGPYKINYWGTV